MNAQCKQAVAAALGRIPTGLFVLTARYEEHRAGMLARWVQQISDEPPIVSVAIAKGQPIMALISESRVFGLCQLRREDRMLMHKFTSCRDSTDDPFLGFETTQGAMTGVPVLANVLSFVECELSFHMDVEGDHDLFIGYVRSGRFFSGEPYVHIRENGLHR